MNELNVGNLIKKVVIYTVLSMITLCIIVFALWGLISPGSLSEVCSKVSLEKASMYFQRAEFERSGNDINELSKLFDKSVFAEDDDFIISYGEKFIQHEYFDEFCEFYDEKLNIDVSNIVFSQRDFVMGNYIKSFYKRNSLEKTLDKVSGFFDKTYLHSNPFSIFVKKFIQDKKYIDNEDIVQKIFDQLHSFQDEINKLLLVPDETLNSKIVLGYGSNIALDGYSLAVAVGNDVEKDKWEELYNIYNPVFNSVLG